MSIVVPVFKDDTALQTLLNGLNEQGWSDAVTVVDGARCDRTRALCERHGVRYLESETGRGPQIAAGIAAQKEGMCLILHADSIISVEMRKRWEALLTGPPVWGRFNVTIPGLGIVAWCMNARSRWTRICTGDQGMFFHTRLLEKAGGFARLKLMEDIETCIRLKHAWAGHFVPLQCVIGTSPRRWQTKGVLRTVLFMWWFRLKYFFGSDADSLYEQYYRSKG